LTGFSIIQTKRAQHSPQTKNGVNVVQIFR